MLAVMPVAAAAQSSSPPIISSSSVYAGQFSPNLVGPQAIFARRPDTPTMRRERADRARALRAEYHQLLAQDGGTLTDAHRRYVAQKSRSILNGLGR